MAYLTISSAKSRKEEMCEERSYLRRENLASGQNILKIFVNPMT